MDGGEYTLTGIVGPVTSGGLVNIYVSSADLIPADVSLTIDAAALSADLNVQLPIYFTDVFYKYGGGTERTYYTESQVQTDKNADFSYYAEMGAVKTGATINSFAIGDESYGVDDEVQLSIGNNVFVKDKAFKVEDGKFHVALPLALAFGLPAEAPVLKVNGKVIAAASLGLAAGVPALSPDYGFEDDVWNGYGLLTYPYAGQTEDDLFISRLVWTYEDRAVVSYSLDKKGPDDFGDYIPDDLVSLSKKGVGYRINGDGGYDSFGKISFDFTLAQIQSFAEGAEPVAVSPLALTVSSLGLGGYGDGSKEHSLSDGTSATINYIDLSDYGSGIQGRINAEKKSALWIPLLSLRQ